MRTGLLVALMMVAAPQPAPQPDKEWTVPNPADEGGFVSSGRTAVCRKERRSRTPPPSARQHQTRSRATTRTRSGRLSADNVT